MKRNSPAALTRMAVDHSAGKALVLDALYCEEEDGSKSETISLNNDEFDEYTLLPPLGFEYDFCWDDEELQSLFSKEGETSPKSFFLPDPAGFLFARKQAVELIQRISSYHGFSTSATVVAVNFLDRFLSGYESLEKDRPWLMQLAAVACLSLAAKVDETHVPLLVDLQLEDATYLFESKTIQRMELLILSALKWRMNPVTPLSFIDHIVRRLGFKSHVTRLEFLTSCGNLILSLISDSRTVGYFPSVLATATMLHLVHQEEFSGNAVECEKTMLEALKISKEEVEECGGVISDIVSSRDKNDEILEFSSSVVMAGDANDSRQPDPSSSSSSSPLHRHPIFRT